MIDADISGEAGAHREFALDAATGRHREIFGKQHAADFAILVRRAGGAEQGAVLFPEPEFLRRHETAFPEPLAVVFGGGLVRFELAFGGWLPADRKTLADQRLVQAGRGALGGADAEVPFAVGFVRTQIVAVNRMAADQSCQLLPRLDAAGPGIGMGVDAYLDRKSVV